MTLTTDRVSDIRFGTVSPPNLTPGVGALGTLDPGDDGDTYRFDALAGGWYLVALAPDPAEGDPAGDLGLQLRDETFDDAYAISNSLFGRSLHATTFEARETEALLVDVLPWIGSTGDYRLDVIDLFAPGPGFASEGDADGAGAVLPRNVQVTGRIEDGAGSGLHAFAVDVSDGDAFLAALASDARQGNQAYFAFADIWFVPGASAAELLGPDWDFGRIDGEGDYLEALSATGAGAEGAETGSGEGAAFAIFEDGALYIEVSVSGDGGAEAGGDYVLLLDETGSEAPGAGSGGTEAGGVADPFLPRGVGAIPRLRPGDGVAGRLEPGGFEGEHFVDYRAGRSYVVSVVGIGDDPLVAPAASAPTFDRSSVSTGYSQGPFIGQSFFTMSVDVDAEAEFRTTSAIDASFGDETGGDYRLSVLLAAEAEAAGDVGDTAETAGAFRIGEAVEGAIDAVGDVDRYRLEAPEGTAFILALAPAGTAETALTGQTMNLWAVDDATGAERFVGGVGLGGDRLDERFALIEAAPAGTTYHVEVESGFRTPEQIGRYQLSAVQVFDVVGEGVAGAAPLSPGETRFGVLTGFSDSDWYAVPLRAGVEQAVTVDSRGILQIDGVDVVILGPDGLAITSFDGAGSGALLETAFTPTVSGVHYVALASDDRAFMTGGGEYRITVGEADGGGGGTGGAETFLSVTGAETTEGDPGGGGTLVFRILRSGDVSGATSVDWSLAGGTAGAEDLVAGLPQSGTAVFAPGETAATVEIAVAGDVALEPDETVTLTLDAATGDAEILGASAVGTILDDEPPPSFRVEAVRPVVSEGGGQFGFASGPSFGFPPRGGNGPGQDIAFRVIRDGPADEAATIDYSVLLGETTPREYGVYEWRELFRGGRWFLDGDGRAIAHVATTFEEERAGDPGVQTGAFAGGFDLLGPEKLAFNEVFGLPDLLDHSDTLTFFDIDARTGEVPSFLTGGVFDADYRFDASAVLNWGWTALSLGSADIASRLYATYAAPRVATAGEAFEVSLADPRIDHRLTLSGVSIGRIGAELELAAALGFSAASVAGFDLPDFDLPDLNATFALIPDEFEAEPLDGVLLSLKAPDGRDVSTRLTEVGGVASAETGERIATLRFQLLEILDAGFPPLDLLQEDAKIEAAGVAIEIGYVLLDLFAFLGLDVVTELSFTPELTAVATFDGAERAVSGGGTTVVASGPGVIDGSVEYRLGGTLDAKWSLRPVVGGGFEAFAANAKAEVGPLGTGFDLTLGPLFGGTLDIDLASLEIPLFDPEPWTLPDDAFAPLAFDLDIPVRGSDAPGDATLAGSISFAAGETEKIVTFAQIRDGTPEADQEVILRLDAARTAGGGVVEIAEAEASVTVVDDDDLISLRFARRDFDFWGDPHVATLDGLTYGFQAVGEFLVLDATGEGGFAVQARTAPVPGSEVASRIVALAVGFDDTRVTVMADGTLRIDGVETTVPLSPGVIEAGAGAVFFDGAAYVVRTPSGDEIMVGLYDGFLGVCFFLAEEEPAGRTLRGLFGDGDGDPSNDIRTADGLVLTDPSAEELYGAFAEGWRLTDETSLFDYAEGEGTETFTDRDFPSLAVGLADLPASVVAAATAAVDAMGPLDPGLRDAAILDVALTGDLAYAEAAAAVVARPVAALAPESDAPPPPMIGLSALTPTIDEGGGPLRFTLWRSGDASGRLELALGLEGDTAGVAAPPAVAVLEAGETEVEIALAVTDDADPGPDRTLALTVEAGGTGALVVSARAEATVRDDDRAPLPTLSVTAEAEAIAEGAEAAFRVTLSAAAATAVTATLALVSAPGGAAAVAADLAPGAPTAIPLVFAPGETERLVTLATFDDAAREGDERLTLRLLSVAGADLGARDAGVTLLDDDENDAPTGAALAPLTLAESATPLTLDLLAGVTDPEGGALVASALTVSGPEGAEAAVTGDAGAGSVSLDPSIFAASLDLGETATLTLDWTVTDPEGATLARRQIVRIEGAPGPFAFYEDRDGDGFGETQVTAYALAEGLAALPGDPDDDDPEAIPVDPPPEAADDRASVREDRAVSGDVLANDADDRPEGLRVVAVDGEAGAVGVALTGDFGTLTLGADGAFTYAADRADRLIAGRTATDAFAYAVEDAGGGRSEATLTIVVEGADERLKGGRAADRLTGGGGDDTLLGRGGNDRLKGKGGDDVLKGAGGKDRLIGQGGDDTLKGGGGKDALKGNGGDDVLEGQKGADTIKSGGGADILRFKRGDGRDVVLDWKDGADLIHIQKGAKAFRQLEIGEKGRDVLIEYGRDGDVVRLKKTDADDLDASDFLFG